MLSDTCHDALQVLKNEILSIGMDSVGNFVMIADGGTKVVILSLKGENLSLVASAGRLHVCDRDGLGLL